LSHFGPPSHGKDYILNFERILTNACKADDVEKGGKIRIDSTVVESDIHHPTDSILLYDAFRALSRILTGNALRFTDHRKRAKRRMMAAIYARKKKTVWRSTKTC
jgi:hypothetical protein